MKSYFGLKAIKGSKYVNEISILHTYLLSLITPNPVNLLTVTDHVIYSSVL